VGLVRLRSIPTEISAETLFCDVSFSLGWSPAFLNQPSGETDNLTKFVQIFLGAVGGWHFGMIHQVGAPRESLQTGRLSKQAIAQPGPWLNQAR
jgi:hypothetical protein